MDKIVQNPVNIAN